MDETIPEAEILIRRLASICDENGPSRFDIYLTLLNLLRLTLYRTFIIIERYNSSGLLKDDVDKLFSIGKKLMENSHLPIKIPALAVEFGMGQSKMTKTSCNCRRTLKVFKQKA